MKHALRERLTVVALLTAWIGVWGVWIPASAVSLRQNAFDLAEWATFLAEVRGGALHAIPDIVRLSIALITIAVAWKSVRIENVWLRWGIRFACVLPALLLMPPYPFVLQLWNSESYGLRFVIANITLIGVGLSLFAIRVPEHVLRPANVALSLLAAGVALYAYLALHSAFSVRYGVRIEAGWGFVVFIVSLILNILLEGSFLMFPLTLVFANGCTDEIRNCLKSWYDHG